MPKRLVDSAKPSSLAMRRPHGSAMNSTRREEVSYVSELGTSASPSPYPHATESKPEFLASSAFDHAGRRTTCRPRRYGRMRNRFASGVRTCENGENVWSTMVLSLAARLAPSSDKLTAVATGGRTHPVINCGNTITAARCVTNFRCKCICPKMGRKSLTN